MSAPSVYAAINAITAEFAARGIAKTHTNEADGYKYRSIDDVLDRLAPLLAKHRLCVLPRTIERTVIERADEQSRLLLHVAVRVSFTLTSVEDGSSHIVDAYGEALDGGDKATAKAMSAAYKSAIVQTFCIPACGAEDADRSGHRLAPRRHSAEPVQGWTQWCLDIEDIVAVCESEAAISRVQDSNRDLLAALSRDKRELYDQLGAAFTGRREALASRQRTTTRKRSPAQGRRAKVKPVEEVDHA